MVLFNPTDQLLSRGLIPGDILGIQDDLPSQTPLNMLTNAPSAFSEQSVPRISLRSIFKLMPGWTVTGEYTYNRTDEHYQFYSNRFRFADVQLAAKYSTEKGQDFYRMYDATTKYNALNIFYELRPFLGCTFIQGNGWFQPRKVVLSLLLW